MKGCDAGIHSISGHITSLFSLIEASFLVPRVAWRQLSYLPYWVSLLVSHVLYFEFDLCCHVQKSLAWSLKKWVLKTNENTWCRIFWFVRVYFKSLIIFIRYLCKILKDTCVALKKSMSIRPSLDGTRVKYPLLAYKDAFVEVCE